MSLSRQRVAWLGGRGRCRSRLCPHRRSKVENLGGGVFDVVSCQRGSVRLRTGAEWWRRGQDRGVGRVKHTDRWEGRLLEISTRVCGMFVGWAGQGFVCFMIVGTFVRIVCRCLGRYVKFVEDCLYRRVFPLKTSRSNRLGCTHPFPPGRLLA